MLFRSLIVQYGDWLGGAIVGDLGVNWFNGEEITTELRDRVPVTFSMVFGSLLVSVVAGSCLGVLAALKAGRWPDRLVTVVSSLGLAVPNFWIALLLAYFVGVRWQWLPAIWPTGGPQGAWGWFKALIMPCMALGLSASAAIAHLTFSRCGMLRSIDCSSLGIASITGLSGSAAGPNCKTALWILNAVKRPSLMSKIGRAHV